VVKLALSLVQLNKPKEACQALAEIDRRYPQASAAAKDRAAAARQKAACAAEGDVEPQPRPHRRRGA
jgi:hypothetical protein